MNVIDRIEALKKATDPLEKSIKAGRETMSKIEAEVRELDEAAGKAQAAVNAKRAELKTQRGAMAGDIARLETLYRDATRLKDVVTRHLRAVTLKVPKKMFAGEGATAADQEGEIEVPAGKVADVTGRPLDEVIEKAGVKIDWGKIIVN